MVCESKMNSPRCTKKKEKKQGWILKKWILNPIKKCFGNSKKFPIEDRFSEHNNKAQTKSTAPEETDTKCTFWLILKTIIGRFGLNVLYADAENDVYICDFCFATSS